MPPITCPKSRCTFKTDDLSEAMALKMVELHLLSEHEVETKEKATKQAVAKAEKVRRPEVSPDMTEERWAYFMSRWTAYKKGCGLAGEDAVDQLLECLAEPVREDHYRQFAGVEVADEKTTLDQIRQVAVRKANRAVIRERMGTTKQERGETARKFAGRVRALAVVSGLEVSCECGKKVSYVDETIKDKVIGGLADVEVKTAVLGHKEVNTWTLDEMMDYIEAKEAGKVSVSLMGGQASAAAVSSPSSSSSSAWKSEDARNRDHKSSTRCDKCGRGHGSDKQCPAKEMKCFNCDLTGHLASRCRQPRKKKDTVKSVEPKEEAKVEAVDAGNDSHWICGVTESDDYVQFYENTHYNALSDNLNRRKRRPSKQAKISQKRRHYESTIGGVGSILGMFMVGTAILGGQDKQVVKHHVYNGRSWEQRKARPKPNITLTSSVSLDSYDSIGVRRPRVLGDRVKTEFMTDTGASVSVAGMQYARRLGIREDDLLTSDISVVSADGSPISVKGSVLVEISGAGRVTREQVYICGGTNGCLLSLEACIALEIVPPTFPTPGSAVRRQEPSISATLSAEELRERRPKGSVISGGSSDDERRDRRTSRPEGPEDDNGSSHVGDKMMPDSEPKSTEPSGTGRPSTERRKNSGAEAEKQLKKCGCGCPKRESPPEKPNSLPYEPVKENVEKLEEWLRREFAASAFNVCECEPLPHMQGDPLVISVADGAKPVASHSPIPVPVHWSDDVKRQLDRDVALGVIEKVPIGTDTTWCHRMVTVPKKDGTPRRTVNFQPLNEHAARQTHFTESPFRQAMMVPEGTADPFLYYMHGHERFKSVNCTTNL